MRLQVRLGAERHAAGLAHDDDEALGDMRSSRRTLARLAAKGWYLPRDARTYRIEHHFESPQDWTTFLDRPKGGPIEGDRELLDSALAAMKRGTGKIVGIEDDEGRSYVREEQAPLPAARP